MTIVDMFPLTFILESLYLEPTNPKGLHLWVTWVLVNVLLQHIMSWPLLGPTARDQSSAAHTCFLSLKKKKTYINFGRHYTHYKTLYRSYRLGRITGQRCSCGGSESMSVSELLGAVRKLHYKTVGYTRRFVDFAKMKRHGSHSQWQRC